MATLSRAAHPDFPASEVIPTEFSADSPRVPGAPCDMLRAAIAERGGYCDWAVDHSGWVVTLHLPEEQVFSGSTLEDGLFSCLAWLVASPRRRGLSQG
ncbi:MAG TPA: hypothetical protein VHG52_15525 [Thermomicrobiales bacterium]|nr:hypothetical protein [Thermomicrobiales bacterium]